LGKYRKETGKMKLFHQILRLLSKLSFLFFSCFYFSCGQQKKKQELSLALQEEMQNVVSSNPDDPDLWFAHGMKNCWRNLGRGYESYFPELNSSLTRINVVSGKLKSIEDELKIRYKGRLNTKVALSRAEVKKLNEIEKLTRTVIGQAKKYSREPDVSVRLALSMIDPPFWALKNENPGSWIDLYIQDNPAYSAILHLQLYRTSLYQLKQYLKSNVQMKIDSYEGWDRLYSDYRLLKDTVALGEPVKAMLFLGFTKPTFSCKGNSYPYPKAFLFNGKKYLVSYDPETKDLVAAIKFQLPTNPEKSQVPGKKNWAGKWVIAISPEKDTTIATKGSYILK
jgi:hypothetical protein